LACSPICWSFRRSLAETLPDFDLVLTMTILLGSGGKSWNPTEQLTLPWT